MRRPKKLISMDHWEGSTRGPPPGTHLNPAWDPKNPYDFPKYYYDRSGIDTGRAGPAGAPNPGGYQSVQGMSARMPSHLAGGRTAGSSMGNSAGGRRNPYATSRSGVDGSRMNEPSVMARNATNNSRRSGNNPSMRSGGTDLSRRSGTHASSGHPSQYTREPPPYPSFQTGRFSPDDVPRRSSPPPLRRRR